MAEKEKIIAKDYYRFEEKFNNEFCTIEEIPEDVQIPSQHRCESSEDSLSDYEDNGMQLLDFEFGEA